MILQNCLLGSRLIFGKVKNWRSNVLKNGFASIDVERALRAPVSRGEGGEGGSNIDVPFYIIENTRVEFTFSETAYFIKDFSINYVLCPSLFFFFFFLLSNST